MTVKHIRPRGIATLVGLCLLIILSGCMENGDENEHGEDDHGSTRTTATVVASTSSTPGSLDETGDIDVLRIELSSDGMLTVRTTGSTDTVGTLIDTGGAILATDDDSGTDVNFEITRELRAGVYFVEVAGFRNATTGGYIFEAQFTPTSVVQPHMDVLGIFSETAPVSLEPDVDSFIGTFTGGGATFPTFVEDTSDKQEGAISLRATVAVNAAQGGFAGWFVSWGNAGQVANDTVVRDMSLFEGGRLTFRVKSPIDLEVGIRSGNVTAGTETSKVLVSRFDPTVADNTWRQVCIPLTILQGPPPRADLRRIKVFFVIASNTPSGGTPRGAPATFLIDDIRWERSACP